MERVLLVDGVINASCFGIQKLEKNELDCKCSCRKSGKVTALTSNSNSDRLYSRGEDGKNSLMETLKRQNRNFSLKIMLRYDH